MSEPVFEVPEIVLSVIVPARNEEDCLGACLESLVAQSEKIFELGLDWELIVVDDGSMDRTREIADGVAARFKQSAGGVTVMDAPKLLKGWTGKANACWAASKVARGKWLLFTDADTVHEPGDLRRAMHEAEKAQAGMLSYSPRQAVTGFWQAALMPLVFSELALAYPPDKVSDPSTRLAAANGQFLLVKREAYVAIGGHEAVAGSVLEDVELAFLAKRRKVGLRFRYAPDALSVRMYRSVGAMVEGWTKNLALLFSNALATAAWKILDIALLFGLPVLAAMFWHQQLAKWAFLLLWLRTLWRFYARVAKSNFPVVDCAISVFGLPLFVALLYRSWFHHTITKRVVWKGRSYNS